MGRTRIILLCALCAAVAGFAALRVRRHDVSRPAVASAQESNASTTICGERWTAGLELKGVVGGRDAQAYFDMWPAPGAAEGISGIVVFPGERGDRPLADTPIGLAGTPTPDGCSVRLQDPDADADGDVWTLRMESTDRIGGTHRMRDGRMEAVTFEVVPETKCDGAGEWRTFSSPLWPVTFDYPASWVLTSDADDVNVECPSVKALSSGGITLTFERGRLPAQVSGNAAAQKDDGSAPYWFVRGADGQWRVSDHGCAEAGSGDACSRARRSDRNGMTVLQGVAGEHRLYRPGIGYLGQGFEISRYLFVFGEQWISLDNGDNEHGIEDFREHGGPVLLDGKSVGDRVVRSVRLR